ncbi:MAG: glutamate synthase-related protein [Candidatus Hadarchaeota archaeon]
MPRVREDSSYLNGMSTTDTRTRVQDVSPTSGMCPICIKECPVLCEIGLSAFRGRETLYPIPEEFGTSTAASLKNYGLDWSDFNILSRLRGAEGIEENSDKALFSEVDVSSEMGGVPLEIPVASGAYGSTAVAKNNWDALSIGAALSGAILVIGENVCRMDPKAKFSNGSIQYSEDMEYRIKKYREFWDGEYGDVSVQTNVEDERLDVESYVISDLEVNIIERKWGQGAKAIGGEVRISDLERAQTLKDRGYIVLPDPEEPEVQEAYNDGIIQSFERHSRVGMPKKKDFIEDVEQLRDKGAKKVTLKTGAYRPEDVAWTMRVASKAEVDYITFDGAGGGTGMSPVPMMNEMSTPTVYLEAQILKCAKILDENNEYLPDISMAGGFIQETQMLKSIAMSNFGDGPYIKSITMARSPITAAFKGNYFRKLAEEDSLPSNFEDKYGSEVENFFVTTDHLKEKYGKEFENIPSGAIAVYTYLKDRIGVGLKQLLAGTRKWDLNLVDRSDLAALTERASRVTDIPTMDKVESDAYERILLD